MRLRLLFLVAALAAVPACRTPDPSPDGPAATPARSMTNVVPRITRPTIVEIRRGPTRTLVGASLRMTETSGILVYSQPLAPVLESDERVSPPPPGDDGSGLDECVLCDRYGPQLPQVQWATWNGTESGAGAPQPCPPK